MLQHWLIELIAHFSGLSDGQLTQIERSLPATRALIDLLNRAKPIIEQAQSLYAEAEPLINEAKKEWQTVGPAAQILIDVISHHVDEGRSPAEAAETVRAALDGSLKSVAQERGTDRGMSCVTVFGGTGLVGRRITRHLRESGTTVRVASRHGGRAEDDGIELIAADAHDERSVAAAIDAADGVVNAISLYVEQGSDTFHTVHVELAARIANAARQAGIRRFVHISGIGAAAASHSPYIRSRGEGEAAVQTAFPGATIVRPAVMFAPDDAFLTTILRLLRSLPAYPRIRRRPDEAPAGVRGRRCGGDRTNPTAEPKTISYLRTGRSARVLLRGAVANYRSYRRIAAAVDADAFCVLGSDCRSWRDAAAPAAHPQSGRTDADRHHGLRRPPGISRTRNFATIARRGTRSDAQTAQMKTLIAQSAGELPGDHAGQARLGDGRCGGDENVEPYLKPGNDEISSLSVSFNRMRESLKHAMATIK